MKLFKHYVTGFSISTLLKLTSKSLILMLLLFTCTTKFYGNPSDSQQSRVITGLVTEKETGEGLPGASVSIKGTSKGSMTDIDGKYTIQTNSDDDILVFSYLGKKSVERPVRGSNTIDVILEDDATQLQEVVIQTGYMTQRKADLTGSIAIATAEDIAKNPSTNAMKSLQGKLPGVFITSDGNPAANVGIQVRGLTSINAQPAPLIVLDGMTGDYNLRDINPSNIASIQVLKDAASASIYGSRAAGGVIIIETKKGKKGELSINYDGRVTFSTWANKPDVLNTEEYGRAIWQAYANDGKLSEIGSGVRYFNYDWGYDNNGHPVLNSLSPVEWLNNAQTMPSADTNWADEISRTGVSQNHQLSVSSGTDRTRVFFNLGYENTQGMQIETFWKKYSMRLNTEFDLIEGRLKVGENFELNHLNWRDANETYLAVIEPPIIPVYTNTGGWGGASFDVGMDDYRNPVKNLNIYKDNHNKFLKLIGNAYADLMIIKGLNIRTSLGVDYRNSYYRFIDPKWDEADGSGYFENWNYVRNNQSHHLEYQWTNQINYSLSTGKHTLDAVLGTEFTKAENEGFYARKDGLLLETRDYGYLDAATGDNVKEVTGSGDEYVFISYFGKVNYAYDAKYLLSVTMRYDGSSKFGSNNQWAFFPAFSLGWRIKNESFMQKADYLSDLKLRFSWGKNGNSNIPVGYLQSYYMADYVGTEWMRSTSYAIRGQESGSLQSGFRRLITGNPDLKWETVTQTNYGIDFGFFDQRLNGSIDYYYKKTSDMLYRPEYIGAFGEGGYRYINGPTMENKGIELLVSYSNDYNSPFNYTVTGTFSSFKNKILDLPESIRHVYGGNGMLDDIIGRPRFSHYGYIADGIFKTQEEVDNSPQQPGKGIGRIRYKDLDGDGIITQDYDRTWLGTSDPDFIFGLNFDLRYKDFDMSLFFQGVYGNQVFDEWVLYSDFWDITEQRNKNHLRGVFKAWTPQNPDSNIPALSTTNANDERRMSTYFVKDASYLKLRAAELGYTLPPSLINKTPIRRLRAYVAATNIFTIKKWWDDDKFTGPDPENAAYGYQVPFTVTLGVNVTF